MPVEKTGLVKFDAAICAIEKAKTVDEVKDIRDKAEAARLYAKQAGISLKGQNMLADIKIRAERKAGQILKAMPGKGKHGGDRKSTDIVSVDTLEDIGISEQQSSRWQKEAELSDEEYEAHVTNINKEGKELTSASVRRLVRLKQPKPDVPLPKGKFNVIYADPPWKYGDKLVDGYGTARHHYPEMSIQELCNLPVSNLTAVNSVLFLWVTSPLLAECWPVIKAWGFLYKSSFVWDKVKHNYGHYNSMRHELLLVCTKGSMLPEIKKLEDSVVSIERSSKHSEKPEHFRKLIERMYPNGKYLELFATKRTNRWTVFGDAIR